jgi:hypothetical protein
MIYWVKDFIGWMTEIAIKIKKDNRKSRRVNNPFRLSYKEQYIDTLFFYKCKEFIFIRERFCMAEAG